VSRPDRYTAIGVVPCDMQCPVNLLICVIASILCVSFTHAAPTEGLPVITVATQVVGAVLGESVTLSAEIAGAHPLRYCWRKDGEILPGETGAKLKIKNVQPGTAGAYTLEVANDEGTTISQPIRVRVCAPSLRIYRHHHGIKLTFKARKCVRYTVECKNSVSDDAAWNSFAIIEARNGTVRLTDDTAPSHSLCVFRLKAEPVCQCPGLHHHDPAEEAGPTF
jgi:hypothetical protein